jgi:hypothetical protein
MLRSLVVFGPQKYLSDSTCGHVPTSDIHPVRWTVESKIIEFKTYAVEF